MKCGTDVKGGSKNTLALKGKEEDFWFHTYTLYSSGTRSFLRVLKRKK